MKTQEIVRLRLERDNYYLEMQSAQAEVRKIEAALFDIRIAWEKADRALAQIDGRFTRCPDGKEKRTYTKTPEEKEIAFLAKTKRGTSPKATIGKRKPTEKEALEILRTLPLDKRKELLAKYLFKEEGEA